MNYDQPTRSENFFDKIDQTLIGFLIGLVLPMLMFVLYHQVKFAYLPWDDYVKGARDFAVLPSFIKICVFINLPFFFLFNLIKKFNLCKGIFIASLLYIIAMLVIKFIL
jgi:hypothetical protein